MATVEQLEAARALEQPRVARRSWNRERVFRHNWWRHIVALIAIVIAVFPILYVASAAFNADQSLGGTSLVPRSVPLGNFKERLRPDVEKAHLQSSSSNNYLKWLGNSMILATTTALLTVILGALAAYAFSRFRFKGRRMGMMFLLLIQMFPQLLALVAIYLIVLRLGDVFPALGLNTHTGLIVVYLGGIMGVNTWLMKGFFDTIPTELDESARVDGATPAQVFWGVILPLAVPILAVIAILSFVGTFNEYVLASALLQTNDQFTLPLGLRGYIDKQYAEHWGPFAAGVLLAGVPIMIVFMSLQRFIVHGLTQGSVKG